ncbi:MAG: ribosome maturation factor RimM [Deferribacteraceae bacterium]|jgi:16S rRNA processing protein RimM|nr:ribosome maturation factor RimM [Deferribacteraceae bacterium]
MNRETIEIGEITGVFGLKGDVKVKPFVEDDTIFRKLKSCTLSDGRNMQVTSSKWHADRWLVRFSGIDNPESAMLLRGNKLLISTESLPPTRDDEVYWAQIEGATVRDTEGEYVGILKDFLETGAHDVFVIEDGDKRFLISNNHEHVTNISADEKLIIINRIGLVEEN